MFTENENNVANLDRRSQWAFFLHFQDSLLWFCVSLFNKRKVFQISLTISNQDEGAKSLWHL